MLRVRLPLVWPQGVPRAAAWSAVWERWDAALGAGPAGEAEGAGGSAGILGAAPAAGQRWAARLMSTFVRR